MTPPRMLEPYLDEPRLRMTVGGRLVVRVFTTVTYVFTIAAAVTLAFLLDVMWLRSIGFFLLLFLIDRLIHIREADKHLSEAPHAGPINVGAYLAPKALGLIEHSFQRSGFTKRNFFLEVARQALDFSEIQDGLRRLDVKPDEFRQKLDEFMHDEAHREKKTKKERYESAERLAVHAVLQALKNGHRFITPPDVFSALPLTGDELLGRLFHLFSIEQGDLELALTLAVLRRRAPGRARLPGSIGGFSFEFQRRLRHRVVNRAWTSLQTSILDRYSSDFTDLARQGAIGFMIGHEKEYDRLVDTLARPLNPNAILVGESGSGMETMVAHLAFNLIKDNVPPALFDKRLVTLHVGNLVAGAPPEELQNRLKNVVAEIYMAGNIILYIPDIHNLVKTSGTAYLSAADALMPIISSNSFPIIGSSFPKEFKEAIQPRSDFVSAFEIIRVEEISEREAERLLVFQSAILEVQSGVLVSFAAIKETVRLAKKYFHEKLLPSSAADLLKDAVIEASRRGEKLLGVHGVIRAAERKTNIPIHEATETESEALLHLEAVIREQFVDQEEAVKAVSDALRGYRSGLTRKGGPIASFLFVGPTGVGKTELAKVISRLQFGSERAMIRFDMSEYQDKKSFFRFIGAPDGSVSGALTDAILEKPYSLILLDEFEKAYPDILDLFLPVLDDGRLTDNLERVVDFGNTIIIATSNAHSDIINEALSKGQSMADIAEYLRKRLTDVFRPELLNRFSKIIIFKNLYPTDLVKIVALNLRDLIQSADEQGITLVFDEEVIQKIALWGYDPSFGARPLRRVIDDKVRTPLAEKILKKEVQKGSRVTVTLLGDDVAFVPIKD